MVKKKSTRNFGTGSGDTPPPPIPAAPKAESREDQLRKAVLSLVGALRMLQQDSALVNGQSRPDLKQQYDDYINEALNAVK